LRSCPTASEMWSDGRIFGKRCQAIVIACDERGIWSGLWVIRTRCVSTHVCVDGSTDARHSKTANSERDQLVIQWRAIALLCQLRCERDHSSGICGDDGIRTDAQGEIGLSVTSDAHSWSR